VAEKTTLKIFIASSAELTEEREKCILLINQLNKSHDHINLEPVLWEYDVDQGNFPDYENIQSGINPELEKSQIVVFLFYSKIGKYTREEFELTKNKGIKLFAYFKDGFTPKKETISQFSDLLDFKERLNNTVLYKEFKNLTEFEKLLYTNLNLHLSKKYSQKKENIQQENKLPEGITSLIQLLVEKENEIKKLKEENLLPTKEMVLQIERLIKEKEEIKNELSQSAEIINQLTKDKTSLEIILSTQKENDNLKAKALEEVEKGNYIEAEEYLKQSAKENIDAAAATFYELAKIKKLQLQFQKAFNYYELAVKVNSENALYLNDTGVMAEELGFYDKAIDYCQRALEIDLKSHGEEHPNIADRYNSLGLVYDSKGEYNKALEYFQKALQVGIKYHGEESTHIAAYYNNIGWTYYNMGQYDKALEYFQKALQINVKYEEHLDVALSYSNLGSAYDIKGEWDKAITYFQKALKIDVRYRGENHPKTATRYCNLGSAFGSKGEYDKALEYYQKALQIDVKYYGEEHPTIATLNNNLGWAYDCKGEYERAIEYYQKALQIDIKYHGEEHPDIARNYNNLGMAYRNKGEYTKAIDYFQKSLLIFKKFLPTDHPSIRTVQHNLNSSRKA